MALATVTHHSFQVRTAHDALWSQKPVTSAGVVRPPPLFETRPQVQVQRHTVEQRIEHTPHVQILDAPVPQKVDQLVDFFKDLDTHVPVQVIEVPKISQDISLSAQWTSFRRWRNSWWKCRPYCLLPFSSSGLLSSSLPFLFLVVVMVVFHGLSQDRAQQRLRLSRLLTFLLLFAQDRVQQRFQSRTFPLQLHVVELFVVVFTVFLRFKAPQWIFQFLLGMLIEGVFRTFPGLKKVRRLVRTPGRRWPRTRAHPRRALMAW